MNETTSLLPAHPGEVLRDWMRGNHMTIVATADLLGVSASQLAPCRCRQGAPFRHNGRASRTARLEHGGGLVPDAGSLGSRAGASRRGCRSLTASSLEEGKMPYPQGPVIDSRPLPVP